MSHSIGANPSPKGDVKSASSVKPAVVAAAGLLLVLFISGLAYHFFGPHKESIRPRPLTANESWLNTKARESEGDLNKLSAEDQKQLYSVAGPSAPVTLRMAYQAQQQSK